MKATPIGELRWSRISFAGSFAMNGVVSGTAINTFDGTILGPLTVDSRTLTTNYNVADNSVGAQQLWLRGGFEWALSNDVTLKNQVYEYGAQRHWFDSETYAFDLATSTIDRDRFFVTHKQQVIGDNTDLTWNSSFFGMENRLAAQLQVSRNDITFAEEGNPNAYPADTVSVVNPDPGVLAYRLADGAGYPKQPPRHRSPASIEDRLKLTPMFALIGGVRVDDFTLARDGINFDGSPYPMASRSPRTGPRCPIARPTPSSRSTISSSTACMRPRTIRRRPASSRCHPERRWI